jgi:hypothetical protein
MLKFLQIAHLEIPRLCLSLAPGSTAGIKLLSKLALLRLALLLLTLSPQPGV